MYQYRSEISKTRQTVSHEISLCLVAVLQLLALDFNYRSFEVCVNEFPEVARKARKSSSMKGNPISLTEAELVTVLRQAL